MNYKFGRKNQWRNRVWRMVAQRMPNPRRATVLYLASDQDLDRDVAIRCGFEHANLIAVDIDRRKVDVLRSRGVSAVCGRLDDIMFNWPDDWPVHAVIADFVSGVEQHVIDAMSAWRFLQAFRMGCLVINMQRGRDQLHLVGIDQIVHRSAAMVSAADIAEEICFASKNDGLPLKSRALAISLYDAFVFLVARYLLDDHWNNSVEQFAREAKRPEHAAFAKLNSHKFWKETHRLQRAHLGSYKSDSGRVYMDSVLFCQSFRSGYSRDGLSNYFRPDKKDERLRRQITALRAITTMRRRGELGGGRPSRIAA